MTVEDDVAVALCSIPYAKPARVLEDVTAAAKEFPSLSCNTGNYEYPDGRREPQVCLTGTLPISYYGVTYNIPLDIWVCLPYPHLAPFVYVKATPTIAIKDNHRHVDRSGRCYMPYLHTWAAHSHHLRNLCSQLITIFSDDPPVYSCAAPVSSAPATPASGNSSPNHQSNAGRTSHQPSQPFEYIYSPPPARNQEAELQDNRVLLAAKIASLMHTLDAEVEFVCQHLTKEEAQCKAAEDTCQTLRKEKEVLTGSMGQYAREYEAIQYWLRENDLDRGAMDVDAASSPRIPLAAQNLELVAEDLTLNDLVYYLDRKLLNNDGSLDFEAWFRTVRNISRKQFEARALALRCQEALDQIPSPAASSPALPSSGEMGVLNSLHTSGLYPALEPAAGAVAPGGFRLAGVGATAGADARPRPPPSLYPAQAFRWQC